jgi:hypothetical protein
VKVVKRLKNGVVWPNVITFYTIFVVSSTLLALVTAQKKSGSQEKRLAALAMPSIGYFDG